MPRPSAPGAVDRGVAGPRPYRRRMDPVAALAMVAAYEVQAADIAATKADGLRRHYGVDADGTRFWDVHPTQEVEHAGWSMEALAAARRRPRVVQAAATVSADSWWLFLSEREEMAPRPAPEAGQPSAPQRAAASANAAARSR